MISVERRDGRKRIVEEKEMEDTELEEGEAYNYQNGDDDSTIDPDVSLSYIDEKLQDVLGHFQKDFEGGVSAENLGAKFGGYGSFLPVYPRSPAWSQRRTPPEVYNVNIPRSPEIWDIEANRHNSLPMRLGSGAAEMALSANGQVTKDACMPPPHGEKSIVKGELVQKAQNPYDQKTLKLRIKVGSGNLLARKNAEIYSGLGLDISPSSSLEDSYTDSEGLSHDNKDAPDGTPTNILKTMTSFLLLEERLLSPLSDDFIHVTQKEKYFGESVSRTLHKEKVNGYDIRKGNQKLLLDMKANAYGSGFLDSEKVNAGALLKKEADVDSLACEELVSKALKLPLLSDAPSSTLNSAKGSETASDLPRFPPKGYVRDLPHYDVAEVQQLWPKSVQEVGRVQKSNGNVGFSENSSEIEREDHADNCAVQRRQNSHKGRPNDISAKAESIPSERGRLLVSEISNPVKETIAQVDTDSNEHVTNQIPEEEQSCIVGRTKFKGGQALGAQNVELLKDGRGSNSLNKRCKSSDANGLLSKSDSDGTRKDHKKSKNKYREFFGDFDYKEDIDVASKEVSSKEKLKDTGLVQKGSTLGCNSIPIDKVNVRKTEKPSHTEESRRVFSNEKTLLSANARNHEATPNTAAPHDNEDWVQCDKCQAWRLLPLGRNPKSLPEKWICSMLDWLPAMNRCSVSEEETTQASRALYQVQAPGLAHAAIPETQWKPHGHSGKNLSGVFSNGASNSAHNQDMLEPGGKKKYKSKDVQNRTLGVEPMQFPNSLKKSHSAEGDAKSIRMKNRGQSNIDCSTVLKKRKVEDARCEESNLSDNGGIILKAGLCLGSNSPSNGPRKDRHKAYSHSKDLKSEIPNHLATSDGSLPKRKYDSKSTFKKRKGHGDQGTRTYDADLPKVENRSHEGYENAQRKEKKARISRSEGKEVRKSTGGIDDTAREMVDQQKGQDRGSSLPQWNLDAANSLKRDSGPVLPSVAATSSSSKVSGSSKKRTNFPDTKGSPVESVSSSPLRGSKVDKFVSKLGNNQDTNDIRDGSLLDTSSPRRFSDGEEDRVSDRSGTLKQDISHVVDHHRPIDSSGIDHQVKDLELVLGGKSKEENSSSQDFTSHHPVSNIDRQGNKHACKNRSSEQHQDEGRCKDGQYHNDRAHLKKAENELSSRCKDGNLSSRAEHDKVKIKVPVSTNDSLDRIPSFDEKVRTERSRFQEKPCVSSGNAEKNFVAEKDSARKDSREIRKSDNRSKFGGNDGSDNNQNAIGKQEAKQNVLLDTDTERTSKKLLPDRPDGGEVSGRVKLHSLPPSARYNDKGAHLQLLGSHKENGSHVPLDDNSRGLKQSKKGEKQNENPPVSSRDPTPTSHKVRDHEGAPHRKDSSSQAATNAIKEAKALKHLADRFKNSGSNDSTGMYFQAALKFLYGASLLESGNNENSKHNEVQSVLVYSSTAKLCEFCAHEYERSKDMASAALAYKCMELAYMRVIYSSHSNASRDRNELQTALQIVPPGESPSSSASDVDNLNNPATLDKVSSTKGVDSPQVAGNNGITAQNRSSVIRLLSFVQDVSYAMEAARKSRVTFAAAKLRTGEAHCREGISSVKKALDFNFQDVDGLLRLVRVAMDAISR